MATSELMLNFKAEYAVSLFVPILFAVPASSLESAPVEAETHLSPNLETISELSTEIQVAASRYQVDPALVAAILFDELNRRNKHYFEPSGSRDEAWIYTGDDSLTLALTQVNPKLAVTQNWSVGIAQMTPTTAHEVSGREKQFLAQVLLNERKAIELVAAWVAKTIADWQAAYPQIKERPDLIATLYSMGYEPEDIRGCPTFHPQGCPKPSERGKEIASDSLRLRALFNNY